LKVNRYDENFLTPLPPPTLFYDARGARLAWYNFLATHGFIVWTPTMSPEIIKIAFNLRNAM
jgi:hypothetical protein